MAKMTNQNFKLSKVGQIRRSGSQGTKCWFPQKGLVTRKTLTHTVQKLLAKWKLSKGETNLRSRSQGHICWYSVPRGKVLSRKIFLWNINESFSSHCSKDFRKVKFYFKKGKTPRSRSQSKKMFVITKRPYHKEQN